MFLKFIWSGGNDCVKRTYLLNDYNQGGLRMVDVEAFSQAQKLVWVKHLLDPNYTSFWKLLETTALSDLCRDTSVLWKSYAPDCVLASLENTQLAEALRVWYLYRNKVKENFGYSDYCLQDFIWWNRKVRLKSKSFFFYPEWFDLGICTLNDLNRGYNFIKSFEDLVIEYDISIKDKRKYNYLMKGISEDWFYNPMNVYENIFDKIVASLFDANKITKHSYNILKPNDRPINTELYWIDVLGIEEDIDWDIIHNNNFTCTIEIGRADSPLCFFCKKYDESFVHLFCECEKVQSLWDSLTALIENKTGDHFTLSNCQKMFGVDVSDTEHKTTLNFLILCLKFYIYRSKFQEVNLSFPAFKNLVKMKVKTEYKVAESKGKLSKHFKKFSFDLSED